MGLVRMLYSAESEGGADPARMLALAEGRRRLVTALELASSSPPESLGQRAATTHTEAAFNAIAEGVVGADIGMLVEQAKRRVLDDDVEVPLTKREAERLAGERR